MHAVKTLRRVGPSQILDAVHRFACMHDASRHPGEIAPQRWSAFVRTTVGNATQPAIARKTGIDQGTISRWLNDERAAMPSARAVVAFARAYGLNVVGALVVAGYLTEADARRRSAVRVVDLRDVTIEELIAELGRRAEQGVA